ncbi:hypothetical protein GYMLUDRAFT_42490 [Collybiopsis luxurians FD-317 M1]|uniref:Ribosome production factor 2 homolog n=1 Tax=Collybiopsis luxurians FD-317 M1 TaxID=944289 RepID=A0A0D0CHD9_9AGAR|nr:hypothetical protein GYMLUDRAFT_42490 [Collybiopsis luxurians FD-317 M1]
MLRTVKPKNARSKRALDAREPKEIEDERVAIFVKGTKTGEVLNGVMKDLMILKKPSAISFSKKNDIHPLDSVDASSSSSSSSKVAESSLSSLEFWASKNDASLFVLSQTSKKRPNNLTFVRIYDGKVLDIVEAGVEGWVGIDQIKGPKSTPGHPPLLHFASELFTTHPRYVQVKSMLMSFFTGSASITTEDGGKGGLSLKGLEGECVISVSVAPTPPSLNNATDSTSNPPTALPKIHIRTYVTRLSSSSSGSSGSSRSPRVDLTPMGPSIDLVLRRHTNPDPELLKQAMKRPKVKKADVESGLGKKRKEKKNLEVDEMGDLRGRVHVGKQDLGKLQTRKMKGLKKGMFDEGDGDGDDGDEEEDTGTKKKRRLS